MTNKERNQLQKEIVDNIPSNTNGRLLLAPRVGKTKIIIDIIKRDKPKSILWVTPSAKLAEKDIPDEFDKWRAKKYKKVLQTVTWMSLHKTQGYFDLIILDEEQFLTYNNISQFREGNLKGNTILSMTGTPTKHNDKKELYRFLNLPILYELNINHAVNKELLSNYLIKIVEVPLSNEKIIEAGTKKKRFKTSEVANYNYLTTQVQQAIFQNRVDVKFRILNRMRAIKNSPSKQKAAKHLISMLKGRKLIFSGSIKQAEELCQNTYHSKTDNKDLLKFQSGEIDCISMVNAGGTGFTYKEIDHLILVQADSDKNGLTSQKIARTLLKQKDYKATIWIISLTGTQDEKWVESTLQNFDKNKVEYINFKNFNNYINFNKELNMFKKYGVNTIKVGKKELKLLK